VLQIHALVLVFVMLMAAVDVMPGVQDLIAATLSLILWPLKDVLNALLSVSAKNLKITPTLVYAITIWATMEIYAMYIVPPATGSIQGTASTIKT
jgi:hypothetical protein